MIPRPSVVAIIQDTSGRYLIATRYKENLPCFIGGKVDFKEKCRVALKREVLEESGLEVEVKDLLGFTDDLWETEHYVALYFRCVIVGGKLQEREPHKIHSFRWVSKNEIPALYAGAEKVIHP